MADSGIVILKTENLIAIVPTPGSEIEILGSKPRFVAAVMRITAIFPT
jgi:hypothetical protein